MPGGSGRYRAALKGFMARQISVLVWAFRARGALFDSKSLCPIAQHGLLQEPWAHKGRLPSCALRTEAHCLPAKHAIKSGARTQISALAHPLARRTVTPLCCGSAPPAARRRSAQNSRNTAGTRSVRSQGHSAHTPSKHARPQRTAPHGTKGHNPEFFGPKSSLTRRRRVAVNPRREEAKIAA